MAETSVQYDAEKKIWHGPFRAYPHDRDVGLAEKIYEFLVSHPEHITQVRITRNVSSLKN